MNYQRIYSELIFRAKNRSILEGEYVEEHHILPKSTHPEFKKKKWNLVKLFPREHMMAHLLLAKIYPENKKLIHAAFLMINGRSNTGVKYNSKKYAWVKKKRSESLSKTMKENNPFKGKSHSDETKAIMSEKAKGREPWNKGKKGVQEIWNKGLTKENSESLRKLSDGRKGEGNPMFGKTGENHHNSIGLQILDSNDNIVYSFVSRIEMKTFCLENGIPFNGIYKTKNSNERYYDGSKNAKYKKFNGFRAICL